MRPFLYQVASLFYQRYGADIHRLAFIFPNRRAGLFFQKYLSEIAGQPLFSPTILTINDLFGFLSGKRLADRVSMLFTLYGIYAHLGKTDESFDEFLYWGEMLLNDFNDVDKYLVDAKSLFRNVTDLKAIEQDFAFLSEEQIQAIRSFWSSFHPKGDTPNQKSFLSVWEILYEVYMEFRQTLAARGEAYEGMLFREVVERLEGEEKIDIPYEQIIFVGLNALSVAEERFLSILRDAGLADFYWDYASDMVLDPDNKASYFALRNLKNFPSAYPLVEEERTEGKSRAHIQTIGVPSGIGQAKRLHAILESLWPGVVDPETAIRTAVVLPDENLLMPVLNSIPERCGQINVTMGYPLSKTPIAVLMEHLLTLRKNVRFQEGKPYFYHQDVLSILNHPYVMRRDRKAATRLTKAIVANNKFNIPSEELAVTPLLACLFSPVEEAETFLDYLISVLTELSREEEESGEVDEPQEEQSRSGDLEREFIFHYFTIINRLKDLIAKSGVAMRMETYYRLLTRLSELVSIPFEGEPLSGLQVMGVLETRALDFDRVIILSMNEGVFPLKKAANSFIPHNLRKGFGLPTYEHQDSVWAYHFYRLIHRASSVHLLYDTRSGGLRTGEISRFVNQLRYHYEVPIERGLLVYDVSSMGGNHLEIKKDEVVRGKLDQFRQGGAKTLSASAINTFLDCPLKFYFSSVEGIEEENEIKESVESDVFGSILHKVMETAYQPLCGKLVTADLLRAIQNDDQTLGEFIAKAFASEFFKSEESRPLLGQNFLIGEMIRKYVKQILRIDRGLTPFKYLESERRVLGLVRLSDGTSVRLKGFIDRMDEKDGIVRIVDYKSGLGTNLFSSIEDLFDSSLKDRPKAVMQVFLYAWMYSHLAGKKPDGIQPSIYFVRSLFQEPFDPAVYHSFGRGQKEKVIDVTSELEAFEEALRACLDRIFDPEEPFRQADDTRGCDYCDFRSICGR